jgi:DNA-binding PadR family transcriptional regulator
MRFLLLALLAHKPTHGYDLLQTYDQLFAAVLPPLNAGQVYTTLARLSRDGLVSDSSVEQENKPDKRIYALTEAGRQALLVWFEKPLSSPRIKDNFYLKLVSARMSGLIEPGKLITDQRQRYLQILHDLNTLALKLPEKADKSKLVLIQGAILHLRADIEWLNLCEEAFS